MRFFLEFGRLSVGRKFKIIMHGKQRREIDANEYMKIDNVLYDIPAEEGKSPANAVNLRTGKCLFVPEDRDVIPEIVG